ncbi:MAG: glycosyltransferase [Oscillospiraceae bacterium]|jgi:glycosyltransferase involved in cell wall biosynthesis|nr:glycosyltransferase [Oscillospiraceae bacterium]
MEKFEADNINKQNSRPKVSFVLPVYNTSRFLRKCLNSIINQTLTDIEIICVNDGSTDNSLEILKEYAAKDSRIKIIEQKNAGVMRARQNGIENAKGQYIMFADTDDYAAKTAAEEAYKKIVEENADVVQFRVRLYYGLFSTKSKGKPVTEIVNKENFINKYASHLLGPDYQGITLCMYDKIYKSELIKAAVQQQGDEVYIMTQDRWLNILVFFNPLFNKYVYLNKELYYFRQSNSTTGRYMRYVLETADSMVPRMTQIALEHNCPQQVLFDMHIESVYSFIAFCQMVSAENSKEQTIKLYEDFFKHKHLILAKEFYKNTDLGIWDDLKRFINDTPEQWYEFVEYKTASIPKLVKMKRSIGLIARNVINGKYKQG